MKDRENAGLPVTKHAAIRGYLAAIGGLVLLGMVQGSVWAADICIGIGDKVFSSDIASNTTCSAVHSIAVQPDSSIAGDLVVNDNVLLNADEVSFIGPVVVPMGPVCIGCYRMNDTGITWGGDYPDGNNATCTSNIAAPQDCDQGRDATANDDSDGHAGFSFTKLDANGSPLTASATSWSCVKDNVTGLIWEVKTTDGGLHDRYDSYSWYNTDASSNGGFAGYADDNGNICYGYDSADPATYCNTQAFVARVNQAGWCGYNDWRLPGREELRSLVNYAIGYPGPAIDTNYFPNDPASLVWSASPDASYSYGAWVLDFGNGYGYAASKNNYLHVRLVRGGE